MPLDDFIIGVYSLVDDWLKTFPHPLRRCGFPPVFSDAEVITVEIVSEYLGYDQDKAAWAYFNRHWREWFPDLPSRSTYVRQCANLWVVKQQLQAALCDELGAMDSQIHRVDGLPMPLCNFRRARNCRLFAGEADYGHCASKNLTYYGFQSVVIVSSAGVITGFTVMAANHDEAEGVYECLSGQTGLLEGDKGFIRPTLKEALMHLGLDLQTPLRRNMADDRPKSQVRELMRDRRLVETVIGQLTERFKIQKIRARDAWHLTVRVTRKILSHTMAVFVNCVTGRPPLQIADLVR
ncbi:MAG: IS982 family transposase [Thiolinea sp.]